MLSYIFLTAFIVLIILYFSPATYESDTLWHIKAGEKMIQAGKVLRNDPFSWSAYGAKWTAHSWLYEIIIALIYGKYGFGGLWALTTIFGILYGLPLFYMTRGKPNAWLLIAFMIVTVIQVEWCIRPHTAMLAIYSILTALLVEGLLKKVGIKESILVFITFILWANIHSSVTIGLINLLTFTFYGMADKRLLIPALLGTLVNPQHFKIFSYSWRASSDPRITEFITEWLSPNFHLPWNMAAIFLSLAVTLLIKTRWQRLKTKNFEVYIPPLGAVLMLMGIYLYLKSVRHIAILTVVIAATIRLSGFRSLAKKLESNDKERNKVKLSLAGGLLIGSIVLAAVGYGFRPPTIDIEALLYRDPMNRAVEYMKATGRTERILNDYDIGDYLIWHGIKPFIDGRADMYVFSKPEIWEDYTKSFFITYEDPAAILDKYGIKHVIFRKELPYAKYLRNVRGIRKAYENEKVVVFDYNPDDKGGK